MRAPTIILIKRGRFFVMNYVWGGMVILSMLYAAFQGNLPETVNAGIEAARTSIGSIISFAGIMCLWSGILKIAQKAGMIRMIGKITKPLMKRLFENVPPDSDAMDFINTNLACNVLGLGNAATPPGISAMEELKKLNGGKDNASHDMCMLVVLNTASVQLIPTTMIALRAGAGSANPSEIVLPVWIASVISVIAGITCVQICGWFAKRRGKLS